METTVELSSAHETKAFDISHAQRILNMQFKTKISPANGWQLTDKNFTLNNGVITYRHTGSNKKPKGKNSTAQSRKT